MCYIFILLCRFTILYANESNEAEFGKANNLYKENHFEKAIVSYKAILNSGYESSELYFNLANAYYKSDSIAAAILYYEKAKKLAPFDEDVIVNLKIANLKIKDKIEQHDEFVLFRWVNTFILTKSADKWAVQSIVSFFVSCSLIILYMLVKTIGRKKLLFTLTILFFLIALSSFFFASKNYTTQQSSNTGVLFLELVQVNSAPNEKATSLFEIHLGTTFTILERNGNYSRIKLQNTNEGWIKSSAYRSI